MKDDLHSALQALSSDAAAIPLYSTVTGERLDGYAAGAAYWWQNTRATVLFEPAVRRMLDDGYTHFVELGPHPVLSPSIIEIAGSQQVEIAVVSTQRRNDDDSRTLMNCVGALHCHGHDIAWEALHPRAGARLVKLPSYPWQSKRFWYETEEAAEDLHYHPVHPLLGQPVSAVHPTWEVGVEHRRHPLPRRSPGAGQRCRARGGVHRNGTGGGEGNLRVNRPQCRQPGASARAHPRRHLRPDTADHAQPGHRRTGIRRVHRDSRTVT